MRKKNKLCSKCHKAVPLAEFYLHRGSRDGYDGWCKPCHRIRAYAAFRRKHPNAGYKVHHVPNQPYTFICGCTGTLPSAGKSSVFSLSSAGTARVYFQCRVSSILVSSARSAKRDGYRPIPAETPHAAIRKMMEEPNCWLCHVPLLWEIGKGKTPHLHHNHQTGEPLGFTCSRCNPNALEQEVIRQRAEIAQLLQGKP